MKLALLVIDMQKAFFNGFVKESMDQAVGNINHAVELFRKKNYPVIWIQNEDKKDPDLVQGSKGFEFIDKLVPLESEKRFVKEYKNSFNKTGLSDYIRNNEIDTVIITGFNASHCILSTYRGAEDNDLMPIILKNALASHAKEDIQFVEGLCNNIISVNVLERLVK